ncbi:MAG: hypothetical protein HZA10_00210 [Nitrospirae bacterium]|nr:hypothetical protein [Nitrospirota bacterium]
MENNQYTSNVLSCFLLVGILIFSGCSSSKTLKVADFNNETTFSTKIPLKAGLYDKVFQNCSCTQKLLAGGNGNIFSFQTVKADIGEGMDRWANGSLKQIFKEVVIINSLKSSEINQEIDVFIIPQIMDIWCFPQGEVLVTSKWTVVSPEGKILYMNTFRSDIRDSVMDPVFYRAMMMPLFFPVSGVFFGPSRTNVLEKSMNRVVNDQYQQFLTDILSYNWWENIK